MDKFKLGVMRKHIALYTLCLIIFLIFTSCASVGPLDNPDYPHDGAMNDCSTAAHSIQIPEGAYLFPGPVLYPVSYDEIESGCIEAPENVIMISPDETVADANMLVYVGRESAKQKTRVGDSTATCNYYLTFLYHEDEDESEGGHLIGYWGESVDGSTEEYPARLINDCYILASQLDKSKPNFSPYMPALEYEAATTYSDVVGDEIVIENNVSADMLIRIGRRDSESDYVEFLCSTIEECVVSWRIVPKENISDGL